MADRVRGDEPCGPARHIPDHGLPELLLHVDRLPRDAIDRGQEPLHPNIPACAGLFDGEQPGGAFKDPAEVHVVDARMLLQDAP